MSIYRNDVKVVSIDFETANFKPASVCSVGLCTLEDGAIEETYYSLIKPERNVGWFSRRNIEIHGITQQDVMHAPSFEKVYADMLDIFDHAIITAHNARFDMGCLKAACINTGRKIPYLEYFDTVELSRKVFPGLERHSLDCVCHYLNVELNHHNAMSDAYGCLMIVVQAMNLTGIYDVHEMLKACKTKIYTL